MFFISFFGINLYIWENNKCYKLDLRLLELKKNRKIIKCETGDYITEYNSYLLNHFIRLDRNNNIYLH
ncbi:hypothetical protein BC624_105161 [Flavobacterium granuli]|uniref:Uncharacterized protein n=1 Tax=Flavobacterium granuli TaxID=280093 RepID=A0A1M5NY81_9FLAO|nr:hypothetical protein BC624_105161 [Flavobacterium granuli]SHG94438.1 hypothetical protein SAMN05443373_105161 [Flavobacterium granuli]